MASNEELKGIQKAAILLIALGPEKSSLIFKHLKEEEIEDLTLEIANTKIFCSLTEFTYFIICFNRNVLGCDEYLSFNYGF